MIGISAPQHFSRLSLIISILLFAFFVSGQIGLCMAEEIKKDKIPGSSWKTSDLAWRKTDASEKAGWRVGNQSFVLSDRVWMEKDKTALAMWREQEKSFKNNDEKWRVGDSK